MQEEDPHANPLVKEVAGHLFHFEEKFFGMSLTQLLTDLGVLTGSFSLTGSLPLVPHIVVCVLITLLAMIGVHGKVHGMSLVSWCYLLLRSKMMPSRATWQSSGAHEPTRPHGEKRPPSVQAIWVPIDALEQGIAEKREHHTHREHVRFWTVFEIEGKNIGLLAEREQLRIFRRFETFLSGLSFHLHFMSLTEQIDPQTAPALKRQQEALRGLAATPRLQALQRASLAAQERQMPACTRTRHFIIVAASSTEAAFQQSDGTPRPVLAALFHLLPFSTRPDVTHAQVLDQLRTRSSVVRKAMQQLDLRIWPLKDQEVLQLLAQCLAPGAPAPSFVPELLTGSPPLQAQPEPEATSERQRTSRAYTSSPTPAPPGSATQNRSGRRHLKPGSRPPQKRRHTGSGKTPARHRYKKRLYGVHGIFHYRSAHAEPRFEAGVFAVADLIAPSSIHVAPNVVEIQAGKHTRYLRSFTVTGYGHHLVCGWASRLHELGLPLVVSTHLEPLDSPFMIKQLERALTRLESQRLSDQKDVRITKVDQTIEAEQIRSVTRALASGRLKIFEVSMTICVHAGSLERLEQRSRYLLSHLRDMQIQARPAIHQQDLAWQSCLPVGLDLLQRWTKLTSDVVSTMLPATSGTVGTPTGVFLGYSGSGLARRPVYLDPWQLPNPHMVVIGETGQGKSFLGKVLGVGLLGLAQADLVALDRDDDFLEMHRKHPGESQRYNLARSCPINFFDLPFGPDDVDPGDPADILAEFLDNQLLVGLALLVTDETTRLSKSEEAYLIQVARATYASKGITSDAIRRDPHTLLLPAPTLAEYIEMMQHMPASSESMRQSLLERLEKASYLFQGGQTSVSLDTPLTSFSIKELDEKWYALMTFVVQSFLMRHRALKRDERYLAYVVEEASYLLKHPAGRRFLEYAARSFRKLGIMLITISQHPDDFLEAGQVVLSNAGTAFFLGMQRQAVEKLHLPEELERIILDAFPGQCVMRVGNAYAPLTVWTNPLYQALFTTDPAERRARRSKQQGHQRQA